MYLGTYVGAYIFGNNSVQKKRIHLEAISVIMITQLKLQLHKQMFPWIPAYFLAFLFLPKSLKWSSKSIYFSFLLLISPLIVYWQMWHLHNQQLSFKENCDVGDSERSKKGSVTFNKVHVTTQIEAAWPQWPTCHTGSFLHTCIHESLLARPFSAGTSQRCCSKCEMWVQAAIYRVCFTFLCLLVGHWKWVSHSLSLTNA